MARLFKTTCDENLTSGLVSFLAKSNLLLIFYLITFKLKYTNNKHIAYMPAMKCPDCGAKRFYVKDPEDQYALCEFSLENGMIEYLHDETEEEHLEILDDTETYCDRCAWHDKFKTLK